MICVKQLVFFERIFNAGFGSVTARGAMLPGTAILESAVDAEVADWFGAADEDLVLVDLFRAYSAVVLPSTCPESTVVLHVPHMP